MVSRKNASRKTVLLLSIALGLFGLNLTGWRAAAGSSATPALGFTYFTDFNGKSGGVPVGWTDIGFDTSPQSTVVEKGTVVEITDIRQAMGMGGGPQLIQSNFTFTAPSNPAATVKLTADIASTTTNTPDGQSQVIVGLGNVNGYAVVAAFRKTTDEFNITLTQNGIPVGNPILPRTKFNPGHAGGQFGITLAFDANSVRLTAGNFDSGDLSYAIAGVTGFDSLDDFGANVGIILGASAEANVEGNNSGDIISTVNFDSVLLDVSATGLSPQQQINALISKVGSISDAGTLTTLQAKSLTKNLNQALTQLDHGRVSNPCKSLDDFISEVKTYISNGLSATVGQSLINDATAIKTNLGC